MARITALPPELVEEILVWSLFSDPDPEKGSHTLSVLSIASFAQTCRHFRTYIYHSDDEHLWQSLFLAAFDHPHKHHIWKQRLVRTTGNLPEFSPVDWKLEFVKQFGALRLIRHLHNPDHYMSTSNSPAARLNVLETIRDALLSLNPIEFTTPRERKSHDITFNKRRATWAPFATFLRNDYEGWPTPQEDISISGLPSQFKPIDFLALINFHPSQSPSKNLAWIERLLDPFYPHTLLFRHFLSGVNELSQEYDYKDFIRDAFGPNRETWFPERRLLSEIIFMRGSGRISGISTSTEESYRFASVIIMMPDETHFYRAILQAQRVVYNVDYLMYERAWGPFEIVSAYRDYYNDLDRKRVELYEASSDHRSYNHSVGLVEEAPQNHNPLETPDHPHLVIPDYPFLAAARILLEFNMRKLKFNDTLEPPWNNAEKSEVRGLEWPAGFPNLEMLRAGSVVGFVDRFGDSTSEFTDTTGASEDRSPADRRGWDWAGVEGYWRRCLCMMSYNNLINFSDETQRDYPPRLYSGYVPPVEFMPSYAREEVVILSMTLKVTKYTPPPAPPPTASISSGTSTPSCKSLDSESESLAYKLPVIHFEGTTQGIGEDRKVSGTVRMLACGRVRWSLCTYSVDGDEPEYLSENVQIGGIGSALGFLGIWTVANAEHVRPLGPIWSWKVR